MSRLATAAALLAILAVAAWLRLTGVDWDQGQHLHPDERFLTMVAGALSMPEDFLGYMDSTTSTLNPRNTGHDFFVYGTLPITLAYLVAEPFGLTGYDQVNLVGRRVSTLFDLLSILLLFVLGARLADKRVGLLAAALAAFTAFGIQLSHFFTVETATNLFVTLFLVGLVEAVVHRRSLFYVVAGVGLGLALASKVAVWLLVPVALVVMVVAWRRRLRTGDVHGWGRLLLHVVVLGVASFVTLRVADPTMFVGPGWPNVVENPQLYGEYVGPLGCGGPDAHPWCLLEAVLPDALAPYLLPDPRFVHNIRQVQDMVTGFGVDWPPNHQWWGRLAYLFPLQNIVLWGMGIPLGLMAWIGWAAAGVLLARRRRSELLLPWLWVAVLFGYQGFQWAKTMRYYFPIYPVLILLAAWTMVATYDWSRNKGPSRGRLEASLRRPALALGLMVLVLGGTALWGYMVSRIYTQDHTRVAASRWIYHNLPTAMSLTVSEAASDDRVPDLDWRYMPANHSPSLNFEGHRWALADGAVAEPARVLVPGETPITVDGAQLSRVVDPTGVGGRRTVRAWLNARPERGPGSRPLEPLAEGQVTVDLPATGHTDIRVPLAPTTLKPDSAPDATGYYVWFEVDGGPLAGDLPIVAFETSWDDVVPIGLDGYASFDNPDSSWGEGFYGESNLDLYADDTPEKVANLVASLDAADYIAISSNRVYGSTERLPSRYTATNEYYRRLFAETMGWEKLGEFHSYPRLGALEVNDQPAEEAWHVYDHPLVLVYAKTAAFDAAGLEAALMPLTAETRFRFPDKPNGQVGQLKVALQQWLHPFQPDWAAVQAYEAAANGGDFAAAADEKPLALVMLSEARRIKQRADGTWSRMFNPDSFVNRNSWLAVAWWYLLLLFVGLVAFPAVATALPNLQDRGWSVSRAAGLLGTSWLAWLIASSELARHTAFLLWMSLVGLTLVGVALAWRHRSELMAFVRRERRLLLVEEGLFALLFLVFLGIRVANPDLWHPWFGGEKPMDFAYLNAVLRSVSFPPYDPWFAGGTLNYYYYGFVFVGALTKLTGIVPWLAYNLAIPSLAAMTGLGVFGVAYTWARRFGRRRAESAVAGGLGTLLAVIAGNLYQVKFIFEKLAEVSPARMESQIPGLTTVYNATQGWLAVMRQQASLSVPTNHWYWNASRAIPGDPITEFPFFTFLYADLHAHMMAMPIAMLAVAVALSWAIPTPEERQRAAPVRAWHVLRLLLGALAIGALWPTNTWDYPTYGLVAAGAIAVGQWVRHRGLGWGWLASVIFRGLPLVVLSLALFWPYHAGYVQPYSSFDPYTGARTALGPYLTVHGIFLFALASWAAVAFWRALQRPRERERLLPLAVSAAVLFGGMFGLLWWRQAQQAPPDAGPSPWVPVLVTVLLTLGVPLLFRRRASGPDRLLAFVFVLGVLATQFVEYIVLRGDIGRMNTVFKFYIQVWLLVVYPGRGGRSLVAAVPPWLGLAPDPRARHPRRRRCPRHPRRRRCPRHPRRRRCPRHPRHPDAPDAPDAADGLSEADALARVPEDEAHSDGPAAVEEERLPGPTAGVASTLASDLPAADGAPADGPPAGGTLAATPEPAAEGASSPGSAAGAPAGRRRSARGWTAAGWVWAAAFTLLVAAGLVYPITAARAKMGDRFPAMGPMDEEERAAYEARVRPSLSGIDFQEYARYDDDNHILTLRYDHDAIQWLLRNVRGTPTILEGFREAAYRWGSRYSINTGLPAVIGWDWHQKQQRNAVGHHWIDERTADVREMYDTTDVTRAEALLDKYDVDYVIVGEMEQAFYRPEGLAKFEGMAGDGRLVQVYPTSDMPTTPVRIYRRAQGPDEAP